VIGIVSLIFTVTLFIVAFVSHRIMEYEAIRSSQFMLHGTISDIERPLSQLEVQTQTVAAHVKLQINDRNTLNYISHNTVQQSDVINGCCILLPARNGAKDFIIYNYQDSNDSIITIVQEYEGLMQTPWVADIYNSRKSMWTPPYKAFVRDDKEEAPRVTTFGCPVFDDDSNVVAIVTSNLLIDWIDSTVKALRPYKNSLTSIACGEDAIIGIDDTVLLSHIRKAFAEDQELQALGQDLLQGKDSVRRRIGKGRNLSFIVYGPLHNGWMLSITCLYRDVMKQTSIMNLILLGLGLLEVVMVFFACRRTIRKMTRPITELSDAALNMAKGNFDAEMPEISSQDEMKNLRDSFVYMQNSIVDYIEELKTTTRANERMESELNVARNIQMGMLRSDFPSQVHALLVPAKEVGGDLYDFAVKDKSLYFAIGDVSGKGVPASLMMAITRAALRFVASLDVPMNQTLSRINDSVTDSNSNDMFVTLFVGRINLETGHMDFCNAGHNPIVIIPPDGKPYFLKVKANLAVGLFSDFNYEAESVDLAPGTRIVAYTDGVNEAEREDKSLYGNDRLLAWAATDELRSMSDKQVVESLYASVKKFSDGNPQNDDITIMSITI